MLSILFVAARASQKEEFYSRKCKEPPANGTMLPSRQRGGGTTKITTA